MVAYGLDDLSGSQLSARVPSKGEYFVTPPDRHWAMVTPWNLRRVELGSDGGLHDMIYKSAAADTSAIVQCCSPSIEAVSSLASGFRHRSSASAPFAGRVAYTEHADLGTPEELARALAAVPSAPALVLFLRHGGAATLAPSVGQALVAMIHLNRACAVQLKLLASGADLHEGGSALAEENPLRRFQTEWEKLRTWLGACEHQDIPPVLRSNLT